MFYEKNGFMDEDKMVDSANLCQVIIPMFEQHIKAFL